MESGVPQILPSQADELLDFSPRHPKVSQQLIGKAAEATVEARHLPLAQLPKPMVFWPWVD